MRRPPERQVPAEECARSFGLARPDLPHGALTAAVCILFLILSLSMWAVLSSSGLSVLYYILFLIPNYVCGEFLSEKFFSREFGRSISDKDFSLLRVFVGVLVALLCFAAYVLAAWTARFLFAGH